MNNVKFNLRDTLFDNAYPFGSSNGDINRSSSDERTAVIDPNCHGTSISDVCHAQPGTKWQVGVSSSQFARIELFAIRGLLSLRVKAGKSVRGHLCPGGWRVLNEVPFRIIRD